MKIVSLLLGTSLSYLLAASGVNAQNSKYYLQGEKLIKELKPIHKKMPPPEPGEWLSIHKEKGQSFAEYVSSNPVVPNKNRNIIYIQPIGKFTAPQNKIVKLTAEYLALFYGLPVVTLKNISAAEIPKSARRKHYQGMEQFLTTYILYKVLKPRLPKNAVAMLGITATDLWPGRGWNFVFGQASLRGRVGVWSIYRKGDPEKEFPLCLKRTIATAAHELGHMFSMPHCIKWECLMNGSNSLQESDKRPLTLCPDCIAKLAWAMKIDDPEKRFAKLADFCKKYGLEKYEKDYLKAIKTLKKTKSVD